MFDLILAIIITIIIIIPFTLLILYIKLISNYSIFFWSERVGKNNKKFKMVKLRTFIEGVPLLPTNIFILSENLYTPFGKFLRKTSIDEIPQLFNIIKGDMSFVGPRPALYNDIQFIELRNKVGINSLKPGLTGWAQINGRDSLSDLEKINYDHEYLHKRSFKFDVLIFFKTINKIIYSENIKI